MYPSLNAHRTRVYKMNLEMGYSNLGLGEAVNRFSSAVQMAIKQLPQESIIQCLTSAGIDLEEILQVSEQMEEYEFCSVIAKALEQQRAENSMISRTSLELRATVGFEMN
jgi:hypothetical protein